MMITKRSMKHGFRKDVVNMKHINFEDMFHRKLETRNVFLTISINPSKEDCCDNINIVICL